MLGSLPTGTNERAQMCSLQMWKRIESETSILCLEWSLREGGLLHQRPVLLKVVEEAVEPHLKIFLAACG